MTTIENNRRSRTTRATALLAGLALLWPVSGWAHSLHPSYFPVGPLPVLLIRESWMLAMLVPLGVAAGTLVLWLWARQLGFLGNLWRAAVLYVAARLGETGQYFLLKSTPLFQRAGWTSSAAEAFLPLALVLAGGVVLAMIAGWLLYRRSGLKTGRIVFAATMSVLAGYLAALAGALMFMASERFWNF